jgi:recombination-promoting nuclease RpnB
MASTITSPHDKFFRASMAHPELVREFLTAHLPSDVGKKLDVHSLKVLPNTFIDEELKLTASDVLIQCQLDNQKAFLYVLAEHQSTPDPLMPFRLMKYMIKIWDYHRAHHKKKKALPFPAIFPLVFYTGNKDYLAARTLWDLCGDASDIMRHVFQHPFHLINVNKLPEQLMLTRTWSGTMEFLMRHRVRQHLSQEFKKIAQNINQLILINEDPFVLQLLSYVMAIDDEHRTLSELKNIIQNQLSPNAGDKIMSLAEILKEEGREQGLEQGLEQGRWEAKLTMAKKMILNGVELPFVAKITEIPLNDIKKLQQQINSA